VTRAQFEACVRQAATYRSEDLGGEGTCGYLLAEDRIAAIVAAADQYAAHVAEIVSRPPDKLERRAS
jgi:hypothetical protein